MDEDTRTAASLPHPAGALETACGRRPVRAKDMASPCILPKSCPVLFSFFLQRTGLLTAWQGLIWLKPKLKQTITPDLIKLLSLFSGLIRTRLVQFSVSASLPSSPTSPQDFYSLTECHIGKLAIRKAPPLFLRRWTSYKQEAVVVSAQPCYPNFTQGWCHRYKGIFF